MSFANLLGMEADLHSHDEEENIAENNVDLDSSRWYDDVYFDRHVQCTHDFSAWGKD